MKIGDPELNPWKRSWQISGWDEYGRGTLHLVPNPGPDLYFWLGADAYPEPKLVSRFEVKSWPWWGEPAPEYRVSGVSAGPGSGYWITF